MATISTRHFVTTTSMSVSLLFILTAGVAVGTEFCNAESPALRDKTAWVVMIKNGMLYSFFFFIGHSQMKHTLV